MVTNPRRQYFNEIAGKWDSIPAMPNAAVKIRKFVGHTFIPGVKRILDVGCGTGILLPHLLKLHTESQFLVEFDLAEAMLKVNAAKHIDERVVRLCSDAAALPFVEECFDLVLCFGILPHLEDKISALQQFFRVLRPQGLFCVGHLMGSEELNNFHRNLSGPVAGDVLLPARVLAGILHELGAREIVAEEDSDWYFVRGAKAAR